MKYAFEPIKGSEKTYVKEISVSSSSKSVRLDEALDFTVRFSIGGGIRDIFDPETWEKAWDAWDKTFRMTYHVGIKKVLAGPILRDLIKPQRFVRRATFYWTRDPDINTDYSKKIWTFVVLEGREPLIPRNEKEARSAMFDVEKTFRLLGADIGRGKHALKAFARASWGRHIFSEKGSSHKLSEPIVIRCK